MSTQTSGLWPIHLKPKPDELLSSWIIRFAHAHRYKAETLVTLLFGYRSSIFNRDIDKSASAEVLLSIARASGAILEQAKESTLAAYEGFLSEKINLNGSSRWILPVGVFHRSRRSSGLMFCPECLGHPDTRYFKRTWRLAWSICCIRHACLLENECSHCGAPVTPHRSDLAAKGFIPTSETIATCSSCSKRLWHSSTRPATAAQLKFQKLLELTLQQGYVEWDGNSSLNSHLFFDGLRAIITSLCLSRAGIVELCNKGKALPFERISIEKRVAILEKLASVIQDWPHKFEQFCVTNKLRASDLRGDHQCLPYWYMRHVSQRMQVYAPITLLEANAILCAAKKSRTGPSVSDGRKISGRDLGKQYSGLYQKHASDDDYEYLMMSLDQEISGTSNLTDRMALLRDKFAFAAGRTLGLTLRQLSQLTLSDLPNFEPQAPEAEFYSYPRDALQAVAWVRWYYLNMRPVVSPQARNLNVFTGIRSGKALQDSYLGGRFKLAVGKAGLSQRLPTYTVWPLL